MKLNVLRHCVLILAATKLSLRHVAWIDPGLSNKRPGQAFDRYSGLAPVDLTSKRDAYAPDVPSLLEPTLPPRSRHAARSTWSMYKPRSSTAPSQLTASVSNGWVASKACVVSVEGTYLSHHVLME